MASPFTIAFSMVLLALSLCTIADAGGTIGVNYGMMADNLPTPDKVVQLLNAQGINRVKIFDTNAAALTALSNSNILVVVALTNGDDLRRAASDQSFADNWVKSNIFQYYPSTQIEAIAVGNEVFALDPDNTANLVPALKNIYKSLVKFKLSNIKISTPVAMSALSSSYPPSSGKFKPDLVQPVIKPMLDFLSETSSYFMVNAYPFFAYSGNPKEVSLDYALFDSKPVVVDSGNGLTYYSLLEAQLDAVYAAMSAVGHSDVKLVVTETGWPSLGDENEIGAGKGNAASYNGNLVKRVLTGNGTPLRPQDPLNVYLFALFNENRKGGPTSERNFGLFYPNEQRVYDIPLTSKDLTGTDTGGVSKDLVGGPTWCVANGNAAPEKLQAALDYACGEGKADCSPIQVGATCYDPNTLVAHASYAFNSYYQMHGRADGTCDFGGTAYVVSQAPSFGNCVYPTGGTGGVSKASVESQTWCVADGNAAREKLQAALDYACGEGRADCSPIQQGATCYEPNTLVAHASYAFNSYYQMHGHAAGTCDFGGTAYVVSQAPSFGNCVYPTGDTGGVSKASAAAHTWCVANGNAAPEKLQAALDYACGEGRADCGPIQAGAKCYDPNTLVAHASYAFNSYYQMHGRAAGTCDFGGTASVVTQAPTFGNGNCVYPTGY